MTPTISSGVDVFLVAALACASVTDLRSRRIKNWLTYPAMLVGLAANAVAGGWGGLGTSATGLAAAIAIMIIPFAMRVMGAGDVKLMAAIGALKGPHFLVLVVLYASVAGGLLALIYLMRERRVGSTLRFIAYGWFDALRGNAPKAGAIPYAPAIAAGVLLAMLPHALVSLS